MHIGINGYFLGQETTGSGQYLVHLLEALLMLGGDERYTLFLPQGVRTPSQPRYDVARIRTVLGNEDLAKPWLEQISFPRACKAAYVDLAFVPYFAPPLRPGVPTVVTIHDLIPLVLPAYRGDMRVRAYMRLVSLAARRADAILTDSEASKRDIMSILRLPAPHIHVVYLAAAPDFRPDVSPVAVEIVRDRYKLPKRYALYLGGFDQRRNLPTLLAALAEAIRALQRRGEAELPFLVLAGGLPAEDTPFHPDPLRMARELGVEAYVQAVGRVPEEDKAALYRGADLFAFPSSYEGFGLPPLEAMACGLPVIAADAASLPEIVGEGGRLLPTYDVGEWAQALAALWADSGLRRQLGQRAVAQAARFSWDKTAKQTSQVCHDVVASKGRLG